MFLWLAVLWLDGETMSTLFAISAWNPDVGQFWKIRFCRGHRACWCKLNSMTTAKTEQEDTVTEASHDYFWATSGRLSGQWVVGVKRWSDFQEVVWIVRAQQILSLCTCMSWQKVLVLKCSVDMGFYCFLGTISMYVGPIWLICLLIKYQLIDMVQPERLRAAFSWRIKIKMIL